MGWIPLAIAATTLELTVILAIISFRVHLEKRLADCMTREDHEEICEKRDSSIKTILVDIKSTIDANEKRSVDTRHAIRDNVNALTLTVAVGNKVTELLEKQVSGLSMKVDASVAAVALAQTAAASAAAAASEAARSAAQQRTGDGGR